MDFPKQSRGRPPTQHNEQVAHPQPQTLGFSANISSHFRRPAKVVKTSSRGSSPRNLSRRRTTASHTTRHRSASKGSISNYGTPVIDSNGAAVSTRPISWHPNSMNLNPAKTWPYPYQPPDAAYSMHFLTDPFTTTQVNGLITPLTQASSGESCYNETFTPLEEMQLQCLDNTYSFPDRTGYHASWTLQNQPAQHDPAAQPSMVLGTHMMDRQMPFTCVSAADTYTGTAPPTPDFFPTSTFAIGGEEGPQVTKEADGEVLVGMGLYDVPSPPTSNALFGGRVTLPHRISAGKGLKLEETFQPSTEEERDDNDDGNDDVTESTGETEYLDSTSTPQTTQSLGAAADPFATGFADQSFFFDNDPEDDALLPQQTYDQQYSAPIWTDVYSGEPCGWI